MRSRALTGNSTITKASVPVSLTSLYASWLLLILLLALRSFLILPSLFSWLVSFRESCRAGNDSWCFVAEDHRAGMDLSCRKLQGKRAHQRPPAWCLCTLPLYRCISSQAIGVLCMRSLGGVLESTKHAQVQAASWAPYTPKTMIR